VAVVSLNFVGDLLLIPPFGLAGAAIATAFAVIGSALLLRVLARATIAVRL
jgi:peptidoglycan biosynthesis protein MviN/MurJ (putative lipid II flippase)